MILCSKCSLSTMNDINEYHMNDLKLSILELMPVKIEKSYVPYENYNWVNENNSKLV